MNNKLFSRINALHAKATQATLHREPPTNRREQLIAIAGESSYSPDNAEAARRDLWSEFSGDELLDFSTR
jgi:hypothetical protein